MTFYGYRRENGEVGVRNIILVLGMLFCIKVFWPLMGII